MCVYIIDVDAFAHEFAHDVYVCGDGESSGSFPWCTGVSDSGMIRIVHESSLTLLENSVVTGEINTECLTGVTECTNFGELRIKKDGLLVISGSGGLIRTLGAPLRITAHTDCDGDGEECSADLRIDGDTPGSEATSMTVMSDNHDLEITIKLNNRGDVLAAGDDTTLYLKNARKDGNSGYWRASEGMLKVDKEVRGAGTWRTEGTDGIIQFDDECLQLSGSFHIPLGWIIFNEDGCTTGHMFFGEPDSLNETAFAKVKAGHKATFHGDCE